MDTINTIAGPTATATVDSSIPLSTNAPGPGPSSRKLSPGAIAAIAVAVSLFALALVFFAFAIFRQRRSSRMPRVHAKDVTSVADLIQLEGKCGRATAEPEC
jgi:hypothetical protein